MNKKFTLIELVISIVVIAILLSIVMIKVLDFKKQSIRTAIQSNTAILQTASDLYYLENEKYPVKGGADLTISNPQEIDVNFLVKEGYVKKDLNRKVVTSQYYWVDVFGKVWGSSTDAVKEFTYHTDKNNKKKLDLKLKNNASGFGLYQINSNETAIKKANYKEVELSTLTASKGNISSSKFTYKKVGEWSEEAGTKVNLEIPEEEGQYLISTIDEYGLETAPFGENRNPYFSPLLKKEGHYYFEISNVKKMRWVDFWALVDKPADSKVEFKFAIQSEVNGEYSELKDDFYTLEDAYGIQVHIYMTSGSNGEKPSVLDLNVLFNLDEYKVLGVIEDTRVENSIPKCDENCIGYQGISNGKSVSKSTDSVDRYKKETQGSSGSGTIGEKEEDATTGGEGVSNENENTNEQKPAIEKMTELCGPNTTVHPLNTMVFSAYLPKGEYVENIALSSFDNYGIKVNKVFYEYSHNLQPFERVESIYEIPSESCINIVVEFDTISELKYNPLPPMIWVGKKNTTTSYKDRNTVLRGGLLYSSNRGSSSSTDTKKPNILNPSWNNSQIKPEEILNFTEKNENPEVNSEKWITISEVRFFGISGSENTKWISWEKEDVVPENTRILYDFSYYSNGTWSNAVSEFEQRNAKNLVVTAYLQKSIYERENADLEPSINYLKLQNDTDGIIEPYYEEKSVVSEVQNTSTRPKEVGMDYVFKTIYDEKSNRIANIGYYVKPTRVDLISFVQAGYVENGEFVYSKSKYGFNKEFGGSKWSRGYGGTFDDEGNLYVVGDSNSRDGVASGVKSKANMYALIYKLDKFGEVVWWKSYMNDFSSNSNLELRDATVLPNGNIIAAGTYNTYGLATVEIDKNGNLIKENYYSFNDMFTVKKIVSDNKGNIYVLAFKGTTTLLKINSHGEIEFEKNLHGDSSSKEYFDMKLDDSNDLIITSSTTCYYCDIGDQYYGKTPFRGMIVYKYDTNGNEIWSTNTFGAYTQAFDFNKDGDIVVISAANVNSRFINKIDNKTGQITTYSLGMNSNFTIKQITIVNDKIIISGENQIGSNYSFRGNMSISNPFK